jgi:transaldolase
MSDALARLSDAGVSIWLDDLSRELLQGGDLERLITEKHVVGVTSNPTIFAAALSKGDRYNAQVATLAARGADLDTAVFEITTDDVRSACDLFLPVYQASGHLNGRVSLEVDPRLAHDTDRTSEAAKSLWAAVDRPNLMIKIPATAAGIPAISATLAEGISVNVTLIFSLERYRAVLNAHLEGLERAKENGHDLAGIASVASFFVSRFDSEVDKRLDAIGTDEAKALKGKAAVANARLAYQAYEEVIASPRWQALAAAGAKVQRPLWASTGTKNPDYPDTLYVSELVVADTVNTMPLKTLDAVADHGEIPADSVHGSYDDAKAVLDALDGLGIGYDDVTEALEREGVEKFEASWTELLATVSDELARAATGDSDEEAGQ